MRAPHSARQNLPASRPWLHAHSKVLKTLRLNKLLGLNSAPDRPPRSASAYWKTFADGCAPKSAAVIRHAHETGKPGLQGLSAGGCIALSLRTTDTPNQPAGSEIHRPTRKRRGERRRHGTNEPKPSHRIPVGEAASEPWAGRRAATIKAGILSQQPNQREPEKNKNHQTSGEHEHLNNWHRKLQARNHQIKASKPLRSRRSRSLAEGPLGCFWPISHCRTVERLVLRTLASTAWLML